MKQCTAAIIAFIICICSVICMPAAPAEMTNSSGVYLCEAFALASGGKLSVSRHRWTALLDKYSADDYYIGTPYADTSVAASPKGDKWQFSDGFKKELLSEGGTEQGGGMNCTGFVWHILSRAFSEITGEAMSITGTWIPNVKLFNELDFSRKTWRGGKANRWADFIGQYNIRLYQFGTKQEMLESGVLQKGDIIWCINSDVGYGLKGLQTPDDFHHIGIYMGSGSSDLWWQSGPSERDGDYTKALNSINPIYGASEKSSYIVIPWSDEVYIPPEKVMSSVSAVSGKAAGAAAEGISAAGVLTPVSYILLLDYAERSVGRDDRLFDLLRHKLLERSLLLNSFCTHSPKIPPGASASLLII